MTTSKYLNTEQREKLQFVTGILTEAKRIGADKDEPEGRRYIQISETLVNEMLIKLGLIAYMDGSLNA